MKTLYLEVRHVKAAAGSLATDLTKHLQRRQHLGTAVVLCDEPLRVMPVVRKQWLKIARNLQRERAATVNAQKILQLTYAVTRMHHLNFVSKSPDKYPSADVFFVSPTELTSLPERCYSLYIATVVEPDFLQTLILELADKSIVFDYNQMAGQLALDFHPKDELEAEVRKNWAHVNTFLQEQHINIDDLARHTAQQTALLDDAIDILLDHGQDFLRVASSFQHSLQLAQPFNPIHETAQRYSTLALLAHRVQTLSTGKLAQYLDSVGSDNAFFLRDSATEADERTQLAGLLAYHQAAGHTNIYTALKLLQTSQPQTVTAGS